MGMAHPSVILIPSIMFIKAASPMNWGANDFPARRVSLYVLGFVFLVTERCHFEGLDSYDSRVTYDSSDPPESFISAVSKVNRNC